MIYVPSGDALLLSADQEASQDAAQMSASGLPVGCPVGRGASGMGGEGRRGRRCRGVGSLLARCINLLVTGFTNPTLFKLALKRDAFTRFEINSIRDAMKPAPRDDLEKKMHLS